MKKEDLIARYNSESVSKAMLFNALPADKQLSLARDPSFWRHSCRVYSFNGECVACGRRVGRSALLRPDPLVVSP